MSRPIPCNYEAYKATAAPIASCQRQVRFCPCLRCTAARASHAVARSNHLFRPIKAEVSERLEVLRWRPEPDPDEAA